jgi:hypothetical protein
MKKPIILLLLILLLHSASGGNDDLERSSLLMKEYVRGLEEDVKTTVSFRLILNSIPPLTLVKLAQSYESHPSFMVRINMRWFVSKTLLYLPESNINQKDKYTLFVLLVFDDDLGESGSAYTRLSYISRLEHYDDSMKEMIRQGFREHEKTRERILLVGLAGLTDLIPDLQKIVDENPDYTKRMDRWVSPQWYAHCALARLGVEESIQHCVDMVESVESVDERLIFHMKHIAYIRQPEGIRLIAKYLNMDSREEYVGDDVMRLKHAERALHFLTTTMDDFPVEIRTPGAYWDERIQIAREYMADEANWKIIR